MRTHSNEEPLQCSICSINIYQRVNPVSYEEMCSGEKPFVCEMCYKTPVYKEAVATHLTFPSGTKYAFI